MRAEAGRSARGGGEAVLGEAAGRLGRVRVLCWTVRVVSLPLPQLVLMLSVRRWAILCCGLCCEEGGGWDEGECC